MKVSFKKPSCLLSLVLYVLAFSACPAQDQNLKLWYDKPATKWTEALPIGNGRLGAMIYGGIREEHIQFNEETLWNGEPREYARKGAYQYLPQIRSLLAEGKQPEAEALAEEHFMGKRINEDNYPDQQKAWLTNISKDISPAGTNYDDSKWKDIELPASQGWESIGLDGLDGAVWCRNTVDIPSSWAGKNLVLKIGRVRDMDVTYFNGKQIGSTEGRDDREYTIDASLVNPGKNIIAIQVINFYDKGGLVGRQGDKPLSISPAGGDDPQAVIISRKWKYRIQNDSPPTFPRYEADYQPFGDVWLTFDHDENIGQYKRELDIQKAVSTVSYVANGDTYTREYFASAPNQLIAMHLKVDKPGKLSLSARLTSPHRKFTTEKLNDHTLKLSLQVDHGALKGSCYLYVETSKGKITVDNEKIIVKDANDVTFYLTAGTNYKNYKDVSGDPEKMCKQPLQGIDKLKYEDIKSAHVKDYQYYFNTFSLDLGSSKNEMLPTNERILKYNHNDDPALIALYLQYGRYLLISSSRPGTYPANLQGIWNNLLSPPWGSKYTTNINLEMNYWPADALNLSATLDPLWGLIEDLSEAGKSTAREHYNASGWVLHHNTDLWRGTAPINASNHGIWVSGGAWLCHHLWDHYLFTKDKKFLEQRAYPIMKEAAEFFVDFLVKDPSTGWLISTPSNSPEQGGLVAGPTMDHQIIRDLFKNCIAASEVLQTDKTFRERLQRLYKQIAPNQIGKQGQLQEWMADVDDPVNKHRHVSHLWGVYPGTDITWDASPELMKAARQSLIFRGDGGTGWSLAWKINLWARFRDGDHTLTMIDRLLEPAAAEEREKGGVYFNLFDAHPPFQIDGNFGGSAGIAEMLVQSHQGYIDLLPALPTALPKGAVNGIRVRGGFELSIAWKEGKLDHVKVISKAGEECILKYGNEEMKFPTQTGKIYEFNGELKSIN